MALAKSQRSLKSWTKQKWRTKSGKPSSKTGERYLPTAQSRLYHPKSTRRQLELKEKAKQRGKQFVKQPKKIAKKTRSYRKVT